MSKRAKVHLDATKAGATLRTAACGWIDVDTTSDATDVTCKACQAVIRGESGASPQRGDLRKAPGADAIARELADGLRIVFMAPKAPAPPLLSAPMWASSCKGGDARCHECPLCKWEKEAERWNAVAAWNEAREGEQRPRRPTGAPQWSSLGSALVAFSNWLAHDRWGPSAMGGIIARIESGEVGGQQNQKGDDPLLRRAGDLVRVQQTLELAYPEGGHAVLTRGMCLHALMQRTPGVYGRVPSYEELAAELTAMIAKRHADERRAHWRRVVDEEHDTKGIRVQAFPTPTKESVAGQYQPTREQWALGMRNRFATMVEHDVERAVEHDMSEAPIVTAGDVRAVVRHGRRVLSVELAARGLIPMPAPALGLHEDIEQMRERLYARR